jgi:tRNA pseudouridine55 synthase
MDIGKALGCGAHLTALRRTVVADLQLPRALTLAEIEACPESERDALMLPVDALLQGLPQVVLDEAGRARFSNGNPVPSPQAGLLGPCRVYFVQTLLGLGRADVDGTLHPQRLVARIEDLGG